MAKNSTVIADLERKLEIEDTNVIIIEDDEDTKQSTILDLKKSFSGDYKEPSENTFYSSERIEQYVDTFKRDLSTFASDTELQSVKRRIEDIIASSGDGKDSEIIDARDGESTLAARLSRDIEYADNTYIKKIRKVIEGTEISTGNSGYVDIYVKSSENNATNISFKSKNIINMAKNTNTDQVAYDDNGFEYTQKSTSEMGISLKLGSSEKVHYMWSKHTIDTEYSDYELAYEDGQSGSYVTPESRAIYKNLSYDKDSGEITLSDPYVNPAKTIYNWTKSEVNSHYSDYKMVTEEGEKNVYGESYGIPESRRIYKNMTFDKETGTIVLDTPYVNPPITTHIWNKHKAITNYSDYKLEYETAAQSGDNVSPTARIIYKTLDFDKTTGNVSLSDPYETPSVTTYIWTKNELISKTIGYSQTSDSKTSSNIAFSDIPERILYKNMSFNSETGEYTLDTPYSTEGETTYIWEKNELVTTTTYKSATETNAISESKQNIDEIPNRTIYKTASFYKNTGKIVLSDPYTISDRYVWGKYNAEAVQNNDGIGYEAGESNVTISDKDSGYKLYSKVEVSGGKIVVSNQLTDGIIYTWKKYSLLSESSGKWSTRAEPAFSLISKSATNTDYVLYKTMSFNESTGKITLSDPYNNGNKVTVSQLRSNYSKYPYCGLSSDGTSVCKILSYSTGVVVNDTLNFEKTVVVFDRQGTEKGSVTSTNRNDYPNHGAQDGFWYEYQFNSEVSNTELSVDAVIQNYSSYPYYIYKDFHDGSSDTTVYQLTSVTSTSSGAKISSNKLIVESAEESYIKGTYVSDVTSSTSSTYPQDGYQDGYWYIRKEDISLEDAISMTPTLIEEKYSEYPYYYGDYSEGESDNTVYEITEWDCIIETFAGKEYYKVTWNADRHYSVVDKETYAKGDYINTVSSTDEDAYPKDDKQGDYWYTFKSSSSTPASKLLNAAVIQQVYSQYPYYYKDYSEGDSDRKTCYQITSWTSSGSGTSAKYTYKLNVLSSEASTFQYSKGDYIEDVTSTSRDTFPDNKNQDGYWYTFKESSSSQPSTTSNAQTIKNKYLEYPYYYADLSSGNSDNVVYKITKWEESSGSTNLTYNWSADKAVVKGDTIYYTKGEYIEDVSSLESNEYPEDGYSNGYWYYKSRTSTSEETDISGAEAISNQYTDYPYYYGDLGDGSSDNTVYKILSWEKSVDKYIWNSNKLSSAGDTIVYSQGDYIGDVNSENSGEYPEDGIKGEYWYKRKANTNIAETILSDAAAVYAKCAEYPYYYGDLRNGTSDHTVYKINSWQYVNDSNIGDCYSWFSDKVVTNISTTYVKGKFLEEVTSEFVTDYPTNGIKNGYWYVKLESTTHIIDSILATKGKYYFFANISYDSAFKDKGPIKLIIQNSKDPSAYAEFTYDQGDKFEFEAPKSFDEMILQFNSDKFVYGSVVKYRNIMLTKDDDIKDTYVAYHNTIVTLKNQNYVLNKFNDNYDISSNNIIRVEYYDNNVTAESIQNDIQELQSILIDNKDKCGLIENYGDYLFFDDVICETPESCRLSYDNDKYMRNGVKTLKCTFEEDVDTNPIFSLKLNKYIENINSVSLVFYIDKTVSYYFNDSEPITIHLCSDGYGEPEMVNYLTTTISKTELIQGWNIIKKNTGSFKSTGAPNAHAIKYVVIEINRNGSLDNKDIYLNSIVFNQEMKPTVLLAFDGIYEEGIEYTYPYLTSRGIPATILANDRTTFGDSILNHIVNLRATYGWDIGQYGCNPNKELLTKDYNPREQYLALKESREWLKDNLVYNPIAYSAPYGNLRPISMPLLKDLGYKIAKVESTGYCSFFDGEHDFAIPMVLMSNNTTETEIIQKLQYAINNKCAICIYTNNVTNYGDEQSAKKTLLESVVSFILKNKNKITPMTFSEFYEKCKNV